MTEHTILVAFVVEADTREVAQEALLTWLPNPREGYTYLSENGEARLDSWWIAEDDRTDRSDLDSAIFVKPGHQAYAHSILRAFSASTEEHNDPAKYLTRNRFKED